MSRRAGRQAAATLAVAAAAVLLPFAANDFELYLVALALVYALAGLGLTVLTGWTGQISLAHAGFMGIGAYLTLILTHDHLPWPAALIAACAACTAAGVIVGLPALRLSGMYLAIATLAFGELTVQILNGWTSVTGGPSGVSVPAFQIGSLPAGVSSYYLTVALVPALFWATCAAGRGRAGRALKSVRDVPVASGSLGLSLTGIKLAAFAVSAGLAGIAGALFGQLLGFVTPGAFDVPLMVQLLVIAFVGGTRLARGALLGAVVVVALGQALQNFGSAQTLIYSLILLVTLLAVPDGLASGWAYAAAAFRRGRAPARPPGPASRPARIGSSAAAQAGLLPAPAGHDQPRLDDAPVLQVRQLTVSFGGNVALAGIDLSLCAGFTGLLGPNGAGKTTLVNAITGFAECSASEITVAGTDVRHWPPRRVARAGVARTFQTPQVIGDLSVLDNVLAGSRPAARRAAAGIGVLLAAFGLADLEDTPARDLPLARMKVVELVRALNSGPRVLLLDEPTAGLSAAEANDLITPLREVAADRGTAVLIIEHDIDLIARICGTAYVLNFGQIIASGPPDAVLARPDVLSAYLGSSFDAVH